MLMPHCPVCLCDRFVQLKSAQEAFAGTEIRAILTAVASALAHLHSPSVGLLHRDVKLENIMLRASVSQDRASSRIEVADVVLGCVSSARTNEHGCAGEEPRT